MLVVFFVFFLTAPNNFKYSTIQRNGNYPINNENGYIRSKLSDPASIISKALSNGHNSNDIQTQLNKEIRNFKPTLKKIDNASPKPFLVKQPAMDAVDHQNGLNDCHFINKLNEANNLKNQRPIENVSKSTECLFESEKQITNNFDGGKGKDLHGSVAVVGNSGPIPWKYNNNDGNKPIIDLIDGNYPQCVHCHEQIRR